MSLGVLAGGLWTKRLIRAATAITLLWFPVSCSSAQDAAPQTPMQELTRGNYATAIAGFQRLLSVNASDPTAREGLLRAYLETGRYTDAEATAKRFLTDRQEDLIVRHLFGEVLAATGRYREAISEFERAEKAAQGVLRLRCRLRRGEVLNIVGQEEAAIEIFESVVRDQDTEDKPTTESMTIAARAMTYLERHKDATDLYLDAIDADASNIAAHIEGGELFTEKYNYDEAAEFFRDALKINPNNARAHLGLARNRRLEGSEAMRGEIVRALEINPSFVEAKTLNALLELEAERFESAAQLLEAALKINPNSLEAHSLRAAMFYLENRAADMDTEIKTTLGINASYGALFETIGHFATNTRRYSQAADYSRRAIELSPRLWSAHLSLGTALLRVGAAEEGRAAIEASFKGDPFNIWAKNTLDLLDSMREYKDTRRGQFVIKTAASESEVLPAYAGDLLEEVSSNLEKKYKFTPRSPIWVEIFPNHEDFAVRTLGLPGLGALGVCFGQVIAQDSPAARPGGQFNWGSTLWHEYTHVVTLQITDHLIPRWFSEGLSVYEERRAKAGWGDDWNFAVLKAFVEGQWFKIADLDAGFLRPRRPDDVPLAYFEASQVCEFVAERNGFDAILEMLRRYKERGKTKDILLQVLKLSEADFDREFADYIRAKAGKYLKAVETSAKNPGVGRLSKDAVLAGVGANPDDFVLNLRAAGFYQADGDLDKAVTYFKRSIEAFPFQPGPGTAYEQLAVIYEKRGDKAAAADALEALAKIDENNFPALVKLAQLRIELGEKPRALDAIRRSFYVNPFDVSSHALAGSLHLELGQSEPAIREFQVALALKPTNLAEAYYNLATAQSAATKTSEARRTILRSLEIAPGFEKAQELLLKLTRP